MQAAYLCRPGPAARALAASCCRRAPCSRPSTMPPLAPPSTCSLVRAADAQHRAAPGASCSPLATGRRRSSHPTTLPRLPSSLLLLAGVYTGPGNFNITIDKAITLQATAGPEGTTIDCQSAGRGFTVLAGAGTGLVIKGRCMCLGSGCSAAGYCLAHDVVLTACHATAPPICLPSRVVRLPRHERR